MHPKIRFYAPHDDESVIQGLGTPYIPTYGLIASNFDAYRAVGIHSVESKPESWSYIDTDAMGALGRFIDGHIVSKDDFTKVEHLLRALLLTDHVEVLVPCLKASHSGGMYGYLRLDKNERNSASFETMQAFNCKDVLFATEFVSVHNGVIEHSSSENSVVVGHTLENINSCYRQLLRETSDAALGFTVGVGASSCFGSPELSASTNYGFKGFAESMYARIEKPWLEIVQDVPSLDISLKIPPLISILLSRTNSRAEIPSMLIDLKDEFTVVRKELNRLNQKLDDTQPQAELRDLTKKVNESFDAIVAESMLTLPQRRYRKIASVFNFIKPVRQLYSLAVDPLSANIGELRALYQSTSEAVSKDSRIVSRNIAAEKVSELLRGESIRQSLTTHLSNRELELLRK